MILKEPSQPIALTYLDSGGVQHSITAATIERLTRSLGMPPADAEDTGPIVARRGQPVPVSGLLLLEGGGSLQLDGAVAEDCPLGYHALTGPGGRQRRLIVGPGRCHLHARRRRRRRRDRRGVPDLGPGAVPVAGRHAGGRRRRRAQAEPARPLGSRTGRCRCR